MSYSKYDLDTPALMVDVDIMYENLKFMQLKADSSGVKLRPHCKTHSSIDLAKKQIELGASGITAAKLEEAEIMADAGIDDIFIANELVGDKKINRLFELNKRVERLAVSVDSREHVSMLSKVFSRSDRELEIMLDINTGDARTGIYSFEDALRLAFLVESTRGLKLRGVYTHDGHSYHAVSIQDIKDINERSQLLLVDFAKNMRDKGIECSEISVGSTPSLMVGKIIPGVTEIRAGTYIFMDADQANVVENYDSCALSVLSSVISRPTQERVVIDGGARALTYYAKDHGICRTSGYGVIKGQEEVMLSRISDEQSSFDIPVDSDLNFNIGDVVEVIPNHASSTANLYDRLYCVRSGEVIFSIPLNCKGRSICF